MAEVLHRAFDGQAKGSATGGNAITTGGGLTTGGGGNVATSSPTLSLIEKASTVPSSTAINLGGFSRLADAQSMNGVTINVNAPSAIDEEGFTRAVVSALNNTGRRTGAGTVQLQL